MYKSIVAVQLLSLFIGCIRPLTVKAESIVEGDWTVQMDKKTKQIDFSYKGKALLKDVYAESRTSNGLLKSTEYNSCMTKVDAIADAYGKGKKVTFTYCSSGKPTLKQMVYLYPKMNCFFTEILVESTMSISTNYMAPIVTDCIPRFLQKKDAKWLFIPYDNDAWVRYDSRDIKDDLLSFEVSAIYNGESRDGLIIGSVEHDVWKTGVKMTADSLYWVNKLVCFSGVTDKLTRDELPHGMVRGNKVKSSKILVGFFEDWRIGMEYYGTANSLESSPRKWNNGSIFGWNSWGGMKEKLNYEGAVNVSDFIKEKLQSRGFENNGKTVINLDSFWDNMTQDQLLSFVSHCKKNHQMPGIYWGPFADWGKNPDALVAEGYPYTYKDIYLYANGKPQELDGAFAIDPTHPASKARIVQTISKLRELGFNYIKLDFLTHGALEADSHYDTTCMTGVQAYNAGMKYVMEQCGPEMFMALSIAPTFPAQYGHSKRIGCDAWGSMKETEYTLNCLSYGWWLSKIYPFNDADHLVLDGHSEGENRARITSGIITGMYMLGDNFSLSGEYVGRLEAREKALKFVTNPSINDIAKMGRSFMPLDGYAHSNGTSTDNKFVLKSTDCLYLAIFNFSDTLSCNEIKLKRLGINSQEVEKINELWYDTELSILNASIRCVVPPKDARVYKIQIR